MKLCACACGRVVKGRGIYYHGHRPEDTFSDRGVLCACGCGTPIPSSRQARYYPAKFIVGHNQRLAPPTHVYTPTPEEVPSGICECGCSEATPIAVVTNRNVRWFKGYPKPFIPSHHARITGYRGQLNKSQDLAPTMAAYFAGILDGEGTILIRGPRSVRISIANTYRPLMDLLESILGGRATTVALVPNRKQGWRWQISHRSDCLWLLRQLQPYVLIRKDRLEEAVAALESLPEQQRRA